MQDWAASEALRTLGAPRDPGEPSGRLALFALGRDADAMVRGALGVFGAAVDEGVVAVPGPSAPAPAPAPPPGVVRFEDSPREAGRRVDALARELGARDRALILVSPGSGAAAARPLGGLSVGDLDALEARVRARGWSTERCAALRSRLDGLRAGGLPARIRPAATVGFRIAGDPAGTDPLGAAPPSGRRLEIDLRAAGIALPDAVVAALRRPDREHPGWAAEDGAVDGVHTLRHRAAGLAAALAEARRGGLSATVLTDRLRGDPESAGRGLARVALALADGIGGQALPACALAAGTTDQAPDRHERLARVAEAALGGRGDVAVAAWTPAPGAADLYAVVAVAVDAD